MIRVKCLCILVIETVLLAVGVTSTHQTELSFSVCNATQIEGSNRRIFLSSERLLYRLNGTTFELEEKRNLSTEVVGIALSSDDRWLVVCLTDLSCEVYNASNLSAQPVYRRENVISSRHISLFVANNSFYVGSILTTGSGVQQQILLGQYGFERNRSNVMSYGSYDISRTGFKRTLHDGFVWGKHAYFFAINNDPVSVRSVKVMRVCHNSNFHALYELGLTCSLSTPSADTYISGLSVVEDFAGSHSGPTIIMSKSRPQSSRNFVCLFSLDSVDNMMEEKYNTCSSANNEREQIELAWQSQATFCTEQQFVVSNV